MASAGASQRSLRPPTPPPAGANCWICLDDTGPLLRNCACRGSAGYAHASCAADYARRLSDEAYAASDTTIKSMVKPWTTCRNCEQVFMGNMALEMAESFEEHTKHLPEVDSLRFQSIYYLAETCATVGEHDRAGDLLENLLTIIEKQTEKASPMPWLKKKANTLILLTSTYTSKAGKTRSFSYIQKAHESIKEAHGILVGIHGAESTEALQAEHMVAKLEKAVKRATTERLTGMPYRPAPNPEASLKRLRANYVLAVQRFGKESRGAFLAAVILADELQIHGMVPEATELLVETLAKARRVLGPSHDDTKQIEERLQTASTLKSKLCFNVHSSVQGISQGSNVKATISGVPSRSGENVNGKQVSVLRMAKDGKYIVRFERHGEYGGNADPTPAKFKALKDNLIFSAGTPVIARHLKKSSHLNGKQGTIKSYNRDRECYVVDIGECFCGRLVKPDNLEIILE